MSQTFSLSDEDISTLREILQYARNEIYINSQATADQRYRTDGLAKRLALPRLDRLLNLVPEQHNEP